MGYLFSLSSLSKSATETALNGSEIVLLVSGLALVIGAIGEYLEEHQKLPRWTKWPFIAIIVASLIGEFTGDAGVYLFSDHLQTTNDSEANALRKRVKDEIDARLALEKQFLWEGPRSILIRSSEDFFKDRLSGFAGQKFRISVCDPEPQVLVAEFREPNVAILAVKTSLVKSGWLIDDWPGRGGGSPITTQLCTTPGMLVGVGKTATSEARMAACALQRVINEVLSQAIPAGVTTCWTGTTTLALPPTVISLSPTRITPSPAMVLPPEEIDVEAGPHPVLPGDPWKIR